MTASSPFQVMHSMTADRSGIEGKQFNKDTRHRVLAFARPYRWAISVYLSIIVLSTFLGLLPPLLIRQICLGVCCLRVFLVLLP